MPTGTHTAQMLVEAACPNPRADIVPCGDFLRADGVGVRAQRAEFHRRVAENAGIRRLAAQIASGKGCADLLLQLRADIHHGQRNAERLCGGFRLRSALRLSDVQIQPVHLIFFFQ